MKIYGLKLLSKNPTHLKTSVHEPDASRWTWKPHNPELAGKDLALPGYIEELVIRVREFKNCPLGKGTVLVFKQGVLTHPFIEELEKSRVSHCVIDVPSLLVSGRISTSFTDGKISSHLRVGRESLDLGRVRAVIWCHPKLPWEPYDIHFEGMKSPSARWFAKRWSQWIKELPGLLHPETLWYPAKPDRGSPLFQLKLAEMAEARRLGLRVPDTLFSNSKEKVADFIRSHSGKVFLREFSLFASEPAPRFVEMKNGKPILTHLEVAPCVFQQYLDKAYDVRAYLIGNRVFPVRIHSQSSEYTRVDWRDHDLKHVRWEPFTFKKTFEKKVIQLAERLQLRWSAIDFLELKSGEFVFLEANRPGAVGQLKHLVGVNVPGEIVQDIIRFGLRSSRPETMLRPGASRQ